MDMTDNSNNYTHTTAIPDGDADGDRLLEQFFMAARNEELPDNGFTQRVMLMLTERERRLSRLWTAVCVMAATVVFTLIGGWQQVANGIVNVLTGMHTTTQLLQLSACAATLTALIAFELLQRDFLKSYKF